MDAHIEISACSGGFRVRKVYDGCLTFGHHDFARLKDARSFADSLAVAKRGAAILDRSTEAEQRRRSKVFASAA
jgi:hypothetical protein